MKLQLLPTTFDENGCATQQQHLSCFVIDDCATIDAGSLATATSDFQKRKIRNIVLTHAHLDHIAGLPLFIDDLFADLTEPICVHAAGEVVETLERDVFNWSVYPRFSELENKNGKVLIYEAFQTGQDFPVAHLNFRAIEVNHSVPSVGFVVGDGKTKIAFSGDTAEAGAFWQVLNEEKKLDALFVECAFPDELSDLASSSHHLTPKKLRRELAEFKHRNCPIYVVNLKPMHRGQIVRQLDELRIKNLQVLRVASVYEF